MYSEHAVQQSKYNVTMCIKMQVHKQIRTINTAHRRIGARLARGFNDDTKPNQTQVHLCAYQTRVHQHTSIMCIHLCYSSVCVCACVCVFV